MPELLDPSELLQHDGVTEMQVRRRGIHSQLDPEGPTGIQALPKGFAESVLTVEVDRPLAQDGELTIDLCVETAAHLRLPGQTIPRSVTMASTLRSRASCGTCSWSWKK